MDPRDVLLVEKYLCTNLIRMASLWAQKRAVSPKSNQARCNCFELQA
jgi:hypothetical protein